MAHDVFISYSSKDKAVADAVCASLEQNRIRCWIAPRDVLPGADYAESLINSLNASRLLVLVFSSNSNSSPQVIREVERAVHKGIPILPFRIEDVIPSKSMEYFVSSSHWLDAMTPPLEKHLQRLADTVQVLLSDSEQQQTELVQVLPKAPAKSKKLMLSFVVIGCIVVIAGIVAGIFLSRGLIWRSIATPTMPQLAQPSATSSTAPGTPTLIAPPASVIKPTAGALYVDDFSNLGSGWPRISNATMFANYENGGYSLQGKKLNGNIPDTNQDAGHFSDMTIEVEASLVSGSETSLYGVVFREKDLNNYYCFMVSGDGHYMFQKRVDGVLYTLVEKTFSSVIGKSGTANRLKVTCSGSNFVMYGNGSRLGSVSDATLSDGFIGLIVHSNESVSTAHFTSVSITKNEQQ